MHVLIWDAPLNKHGIFTIFYYMYSVQLKEQNSKETCRPNIEELLDKFAWTGRDKNKWGKMKPLVNIPGAPHKVRYIKHLLSSTASAILPPSFLV